jgi:hypothetical protein
VSTEREKWEKTTKDVIQSCMSEFGGKAISLHRLAHKLKPAITDAIEQAVAEDRKARGCTQLNHIDLMRDEFIRIKGLTNDSEIRGLCDRAISQTEQTVPVIVRLDSAERERDTLRGKLEEVCKIIEQIKVFTCHKDVCEINDCDFCTCGYREMAEKIFNFLTKQKGNQ